MTAIADRGDWTDDPSGCVVDGENPVAASLEHLEMLVRTRLSRPTLKEARNMTLVVLALSAVVGGIIALSDYGLHELFIFIVTKSWQH